MGRRAVLAAFLLADALLPTLLPAAEPLPAVGSVPEACERLAWLGKESEPERIEVWVEENREKELARRSPGLSGAPRGAKEPESLYKSRMMSYRMAVSDVKAALREERKAWLGRERKELLSSDIPDALPVRLGIYDADRAEYPVLIGFGWPTSVLTRIPVAEREKKFFSERFPPSLRALFRLNEKGELYLLSADAGRIGQDIRVSVAQSGPRLLWQGSHDSWVTAVALRPDGSQALSAGADAAFSAWDLETGTRLWRLEDAEMALSLAFSPDGSSFATGGTDSLVRLRDAEGGKEIWKAAAGGMVFSVSFSPDGRYVASGDDGGSVRVWNAQTGKEVLRTDLGASVRAVAFSPRGKRIVLGTDGQFAVLWDMAADRQIWRSDLDQPVYAVGISTGEQVAVGGGGEGIRLLRPEDGTEVWSRKTGGETRALAFDPSGRILASGGSGCVATVFLAAGGEPVWSVSVGSPIRAVALASNGMKLLVGAADFTVRYYEVEEGDRLLLAYSSWGRIYVERGAVNRLFR